MPIDADKAIRPYLDYEIEARSPILHDGPEGHTGVGALIDNQATLWAESGHVLVHETGAATPYGPVVYDPLSPGTFYFVGSWVVPFPQHANSDAGEGRRFLSVFIRSFASGGDLEADWEWRILDDSNTVLVTGGSYVDGGRLLQVPLPDPDVHNTGPFFFSLQVAKGIHSHTLRIDSVTAWLRRSPDERNRLDYIELAGSGQAEWRAALDVYTTRCLVATNEILHRNNLRPVVSKGLGPLLHSAAALEGPEPGCIVLRDDEGESNEFPSPYWEWMYFPRQGVRLLRVFCNATTDKETEREVQFSFADYPNDPANGGPLVVDDFGTTYNWNDWLSPGVSGQALLVVPEGAGPFRLRLNLIPSETSTAPVYVHQVHVFEYMDPAAPMGGFGWS